MAMRDKLAERVQPLLEPGERIQEIFPARGGVSPWISAQFGALGALLFSAFIKWRIVAVTDRSVLLVRSGASGTSAKEILARLPRHTQLGPVKGIWPKIQVGPEKLWVHRRFHKDITAADAKISHRAA